MMMLLRKEQLDAFKTVSEAGLEKQLLRRLDEPFPRCKEIYGEAALAALVQLGLDRARKFGLELEDDILCYLWTMLLLGSHFESDPQLKWAPAALAEPQGTPPALRVAALWEQAQAYRQRVMGPNDSFYLAALRSLEGKSVEDLTKLASRSQRDLLIQLATMYPQKCREGGEPALYELTRLAVEACRPYDMLDRWAVVLVAELMFLFGAGVMSDPLAKWAPEALKNAEAAPIDRKLQALLDAGGKHASRIGAHGAA